jgi:hypothetical protein
MTSDDPSAPQQDPPREAGPEISPAPAGSER